MQYLGLWGLRYSQRRSSAQEVGQHGKHVGSSMFIRQIRVSDVRSKADLSCCRGNEVKP